MTGMADEPPHPQSEIFTAQLTEVDRGFKWSAPRSAHDWDPALAVAEGGFLQSWGWGEFKHEVGWTPGRYVLLATGNRRPPQPLIGAQILFRPVPRVPLPVSIAYIPRGPVAFAAAPEHDFITMRAFWEGIHRQARGRGAIFLKVEPNTHLGEGIARPDVDRRMAALGFMPAARLQPARTIVLDLDKSEDALLKAMKPKTRYNLRLAVRRGVQVRQAETLADLHAFYKLLEVTAARDEFGIHTFAYYEKLWREFSGGSRLAGLLILLADHPDPAEQAAGPIAGLLALRFGKEAVYMYGASANKGREHMPNYLLQWEAIQWARTHGCSLYDFWGIPDPPAETESEAQNELSPVNTRSGLRGVYWFKKGFGGREIDYPGAYDFVYNPFLYKLWLRWRGASLG